MSTDYEETARLRLVMQNADEALRNASTDLSQSRVKGSKERTQCFEKLAIGSGATIAAIVAFLGGHSGKLQSEWILRCSLVALVVAMTAALYRNLGYPNSVLAAKNRARMEASRHQQCKSNYFLVDRDVVSQQSGKPIDLQKWSEGFRKSNAGLETLIKERTEAENGFFAVCRRAEYVCLTCISIAMISLVALALFNF